MLAACGRANVCGWSWLGTVLGVPELLRLQAEETRRALRHDVTVAARPTDARVDAARAAFARLRALRLPRPELDRHQSEKAPALLLGGDFSL